MVYPVIGQRLTVFCLSKTPDVDGVTMTVLSITTLDKQGNHRHFMLGNLAVANGLDAVNGIVATGNTLQAVQLEDDEGTWSLPVTAFTGEPISSALNQAEAWWKRLRSSDQATERTSFIAWIDRQITREEQSLVRTEQTLTLIDVLIHQGPVSGIPADRYLAVRRSYERL